MFKGLSNFAKSKNGMWVLVIIIVLFVIWALMSYSKTKGVSDNMTTGYTSGYTDTISNQVKGESVVGASSLNSASAVQPQAQPVLTAEQLLPKDSNSQFAAGPNGNLPNPIVVDLMSAGAFIGLSSISNTLKNANQQIRPDPMIVKADVGPWNNSTYEPDLGRVPLDLGC